MSLIYDNYNAVPTIWLVAYPQKLGDPLKNSVSGVWVIRMFTSGFTGAIAAILRHRKKSCLAMAANTSVYQSKQAG